MEKFLSLPVEKQNKIIDAALVVFGTNGYKKTSISDIAAASGISKAMVFHYFGTKKDLYLYLITKCCNILINEFNDKFDNSLTDFFDRIRFATNIKMLVMKKHPAILSFLNSVYFENADEVKTEIKAILAQGEDIRSKIALNDINESKFKEGIDSKLVLKMLVWFAEGFVSEIPNKEGVDIDILYKEFDDCMNLLKNNFYKQEYL